MSSQENLPSVITLDDSNSLQILLQYVEFAQQKGAFLLQEAEVLKRSADVLVNNVPDNDIDSNKAKELLILGATKGQRHGAYTLNDAALLSKVVQYVGASLQNQQPVQEQVQQPVQQPVQQQVQQEVEEVQDEDEDENDDDLGDLAEPIPLKPKEV